MSITPDPTTSVTKILKKVIADESLDAPEYTVLIELVSLLTDFGVESNGSLEQALRQSPFAG